MIQEEHKNTYGRPVLENGKARTKIIGTRLTIAEWKGVMKRINDSGKKPSEYLRELILVGHVKACRTQEDRQQIRMLEGACNNLNQLTKLAHQVGIQNTESELTGLLDVMTKIIYRL